MGDRILGYISNQYDMGTAASMSPYPSDYLGSVQLLQNSGFSPLSDSSPLNSTLYEVFNRFVQKTGLDTTASKLKDEYLASNPSMQRAIDLYSALENTFASKAPGEQAAIVDFLNGKIEDFVTEKDTDQSGTLTQEEAGVDQTLFRSIDADNDNTINSEEMESHFYSDFTQLNNVLNYFQSTSGALLDLYA
ncbi:MAG: hypothetical protein ACM3SY_22590 [Candidatus Omnitrophota bacterium]